MARLATERIMARARSRSSVLSGTFVHALREKSTIPCVTSGATVTLPSTEMGPRAFLLGSKGRNCEGESEAAAGLLVSETGTVAFPELGLLEKSHQAPSPRRAARPATTSGARFTTDDNTRPGCIRSC